jgi:hypothetical protein
MLSSLPIADFERNLDRLLTLVEQKGSQAVMFELPLPLMCNEYGRVQREQAFRHHVALVPKRVLMAVLSTGDATDDSIHLTQAGHERLAGLVSQMFQ